MRDIRRSMQGIRNDRGKEVVAYSTKDGHIYCVECINKDSEITEKIEKAITAGNSEKSLYFCDLCEKRIK